MAFVYEKISAEDQKAHGLEKDFITKWLIDKENGMFIVYTGGGGDPGGDRTNFCELHINNQTIKFHVRCSFVNDEVYNVVPMIAIPEHCTLSMQQVMKIIDNALYAFGCFGSWQAIKAVHATRFADHLLERVKGGL